MSDELDETTDESSVIQQLRDQAKGKKDADARAAAAERKLAFAEAGIPLSDPRAKYFMAGYDGDLTAEAIKAEAASAGFFSQEAPAANAQEAQALANIAAASEGAEVPPVLPADEEQDAALRAAVASGEVRTPEQIGNWLQARNQPVAWDGPQPWDDGGQFRSLV